MERNEDRAIPIIKYCNIPFIPVDREFSRVCLDDRRPTFSSTASSSSRSLRICTIANVWARLMTHSKVRSRLTNRLAFAKRCMTSTCDRFLIRDAFQFASTVSTGTRVRRQALRKEKIKQIRITINHFFVLHTHWCFFTCKLQSCSYLIDRITLQQGKTKLGHYFIIHILIRMFLKLNLVNKRNLCRWRIQKRIFLQDNELEDFKMKR